VISLEELQLAARNHGMPLEALRHEITPVGLHYLLIHYDIPFVDGATWALHVDGNVERTLTLSLGELRALPSVEVAVTMECAGNGRALLEPHVLSQPWLRDAVGTARWRGVEVRTLLAEVGTRADAVEVLFSAVDRGIEGETEQQYARSLSLADATAEGVVLAYEMNGAPLLPQHGFPLRLVVPGWYGMTNVKWLDRITVLDRPFDGYQQARAYRMRASEDDEGTAVQKMAPRSLVVPPGVPEFLTRARTVAAGPCVLEGRAWPGRAPVEAVEVSVDGGETWSEAALEDDRLGRWAWRGWRYEWDAAPGAFRVGSRTRDAEGNEQPLEPTWNVGGYANNAVQWVDVTVVEC
jgi:DMSO/TMAO reductase YedYZ molybdopterin-dependent catalytic subunit